MNSLRLYILFLILTFCSFSEAQDTKEQARKHFTAEEYSKALTLYTQLLVKFPGEPEYQFYTGVSLIKLNKDLDEAVALLKPASVAAYSPLSLYYLGRALHLSYNFEDAIKAYSKFMMKGSKADVKKYEVSRLIEMARNGMEYTRSGHSLIVQSSKIIHSDQLQLITGINGSGKLIRKPVEFCTKTDRRSSYRPWMFLPSYTEVNEYVYVSGFENGKKNKKQLFRIRNINHETWGFPEPLSNIINTRYDEEFPYFDTKTSTLYFSSTGHSSMGGYDIFKSVYDWNTKTWSQPENLGFPFNSPYDDYAYVPDDLTRTVSFVSNRNSSEDKVELYNARLNGDRITINNTEEIRKTSLMAVAEPERIIVHDSSSIAKSPAIEPYKGDYNKILAEALQLQIKADSFARITRDLRIVARETPDDSIKKQLVKDILRNDKMAKSIQREADVKFAEARKIKKDINQVSDSMVQPVKQINDISIYRYKPEVVTRTDDFTILKESPYSELKPIPYGLPADSGLVYRIQLGAFSKAKPNNAFGGISPVYYEQMPGSSILKYYAGKFYSHNGVARALEIIRSQGFTDAFIVAFHEGKPISTEKAKEIEFAGFRL